MDWAGVCREGVAALQLQDLGAKQDRPYLSFEFDPGLPLLAAESQLAAYAALNLYRRIAAGEHESEAGELGASLASALFAREFTPCLERRFRRALTESLTAAIDGQCPAGALCRLAGRWAPRDVVDAVRPRPSLVWVNEAVPRGVSSRRRSGSA